MQPAKVIQFPIKRPKARPVKSADGFHYFNEQQIKLLRRTVKDAASLAKQKNQVTAVREWMLIDILTSSGLRSAEAADLRCGDLKTGYGECALFIRNGKGNKSRTIQIPESLRTHLKSFITWKATRQEPTGQDDHLFMGQRGPWSPAAVQQATKKWLKQLNLYQDRKATHALRHSYAVALYRRERDLRAVQKQLGHSSITTTMIYADVTAEDVQAQIKGLWN